MITKDFEGHFPPNVYTNLEDYQERKKTDKSHGKFRFNPLTIYRKFSHFYDKAVF